MAYYVINDDGTQKALDTYRDKLVNGASRISDHLSIKEFFRDEKSGWIAGRLVDAFEAIRKEMGDAIQITSGYRTLKKQSELKAAGYKAADISPHVEGMALDLYHGNLFDLLKACRKVAAETGYLRIGWKTYWDAKQKFIHIDVCPYYWGLSGSLRKLGSLAGQFAPGNHPKWWEEKNEW